ncbi:PKD domain-containing protein [Paenibacillus sp. 32O-W]|nr:PKD domain-containing protein [Paenibacillus sp. 32O-W]
MPAQAEEPPDFGNSHITPYKDPDGVPTKRFAVGFMSYEIWSNSSGEWTGKRPGDEVQVSYTYNFAFPGRTVRDVKVIKFMGENNKHVEYFINSRQGGQDYGKYTDYFAEILNNPVIKIESGIGSSSINFTASINGKLQAKNPFDLREDPDTDPCPSCGPKVKAYRYYFPVLFEFDLEGQHTTRHYTTDGKSLSSIFPDKVTAMQKGGQYAATPPSHPDYEYVGYKFQKDGSQTGELTPGLPPAITYDGSYDTYTLYLYYKKSEAIAIVKHFTEDGQSLSSVFPDREVQMKEGQSLMFSPPEHAGFSYLGYKKTTTGNPPGMNKPYSSGGFGPFTYDGSFKTLYIYFIYAAKDVPGSIHIRHMVRAGPNGHFENKGETVIPVASLPAKETVHPDGSYGSVIGRSLHYSHYSDEISGGMSVAVTLQQSQPKAYVTFFYQTKADFTGDFEVLPDTINYRDTFRLVPKDFRLNGCAYQYHYYKIERNGTFTTPRVMGQTAETVYSIGNYPWIIGVGQHLVYMKIKTTCGESDWIGPKPLVVKGPATNSPPQFKIGFVHPDRPTQPVYEVVEGTVLDLMVIFDDSVPTPYDPDGDTLYFNGFDLERGTPFIQSLRSKGVHSDVGIHQITMDSVGYHSVSGTMRDEFGLTSSASTYIRVVPKNPVPIATCPAEVVENRQVPPSAFDSGRSYSPVGRTIDHSRDEWTNRRTVYSNGTSKDIVVQVSLHVYDSFGLKSLEPATCDIVVKPDIPPVARLDVPPVAVRQTAYDIVNKSYSPDGDPIVQAEYRYKYDRNNNGFGDDEWVSLPGSLQKAVFRPAKVGKYLFHLKVTEAYGKWGDTSEIAETELTMDVVNNAPEVSFDMEGKYPQPNLNLYTTVTPQTMMGWPVYVTNEARQVYNKNNLWEVKNGWLASGEGRNFGQQENNIYHVEDPNRTAGEYWTSLGVTNNGFGTNRLSPWRSASSFDLRLNHPVVGPNGYLMEFEPYDYRNDLPKIRSNKKYIFFDHKDSIDFSIKKTTIYALDPKKLSPAEMYVEDFRVKYRYQNGSPFVYTIAIPEGLHTQWEMAGQYLYTFNFKDSKYEAVVYDIFTGNEIRRKTFPDDLGRSFQWGVWKISHASGPNVYLRRNIGTNVAGEAHAEWILMTPELELIDKPSWKVPAIRSYNWVVEGNPYVSIQPFFTDPTGAIYAYEGVRIPNGSYYYWDLNVTKYNPDLSLAWRTYLTAPAEAGYPNRASAGGFSSMFQLDQFNSLMINPLKGELLAKQYRTYWDGWIPLSSEVINVINLSNGTIKGRLSESAGDDMEKYHYSTPDRTKMTVDWQGEISKADRSFTTTIDGYRTGFLNDYNCGRYNNVLDTSGQLVASFVSSNCYNYDEQIFGEYFGDGVYVYMTEPRNQNDSKYYLNVAVGTPTTTQPLFRSFTNGQFYSPSSINGDVEMLFSFRMENADYDSEWLGLSFRMQDSRNRYAAETDGKNIRIAKYVNGTRTVLKTMSYPLQSKRDYTFKLRIIGAEMQLFLDGAPLFTVSDSAFSGGRYGYFADKSFVSFGPLAYRALQLKDEWSHSYAIWDPVTAKAEVRYDNIRFEDPENDPMSGAYEWTIQHTVRFINNQGVSALHNRSFASEQLVFDKVGDYVVRLQARDDPHPDYRHPSNVFGQYRKLSDPFTRKVTVHRRPVSLFSVEQNSSGKLVWHDSSYDPDRYESPSRYSNENTGIDYLHTRGIMERKYYYRTPGGNYVTGKLMSPQEIGRYEIGMAVKDEYGAWSDYTVVYLDVGRLSPPNTPPVPGFTASAVNTYRGVPVTFNSTAYDLEDGGRENLPHEYYIRTAGSGGGADMLHSTSRTSWTKTFGSVGSFVVRQIVEDSAGASAQYEMQIQIHNRKPAATVVQPSSSDPSKPTRFDTLRPTFRWTFVDLDGDEQQKYQLRIYRLGGELVADTYTRGGSALQFVPTQNLPEGATLYVNVRAHDGYEWSDWSGPKYFYIETNRPPAADFDWMPKPVWEGDTLTLIDLSSDPDGDELTYNWNIRDPGGTVSTFTAVPVIPNAKPGSYLVTLTVSDGQLQHSVSKTVTVLPLTLVGDVRHTAEWEAIHRKAGHEVANHPKDFYAGEILLVSAVTSAAPVARVDAELKAKGLDGKLLETAARLQSSGDPTVYNGELYNVKWSSLTEGLDKGTYNVVFTVRYQNGVVKTATVPIRIIGSVYSEVGVHRRQ